MARNDRLVRLWQQKTGNIDAAADGTYTAMNTVLMHLVAQGTLSARCVCDIETNTLTMKAVWQVSHDATTWENVHPSNGAAYVALGTGTAGADPTITKHVDAPAAVYAARYARIAILNEAAAGNAVDTYDVSYSFVRDDLAL
jgi:hypothetical protein